MNGAIRLTVAAVVLGYGAIAPTPHGDHGFGHPPAPVFPSAEASVTAQIPAVTRDICASLRDHSLWEVTHELEHQGHGPVPEHVDEAYSVVPTQCPELLWRLPSAPKTTPHRFERFPHEGEQLL